MLSLVLLLLSPGFSSFFLQIFPLLCTSPFFSLQIPSLDPDHSLLWMVIFLLLHGFCYCMQILLFPANLATALVYGRWKPLDIALTPSLSFLSTHLFEGDRPSRVLSGFPTSYSTPLSFLPQIALLYLMWYFLEVHITFIRGLKTALQVPLLMFSPLLLWNAPFC